VVVVLSVCLCLSVGLSVCLSVSLVQLNKQTNNLIEMNKQTSCLFVKLFVCDIINCLYYNKVVCLFV
jgi:hypothetical protein